MISIRRYVLVDRDNNEGLHEYRRYDKAETDAQLLGHAVVARIYEFTDSELVFTPDDSDIWPPSEDPD